MSHHLVMLHDRRVLHNSRMFHGGVLHRVVLHSVWHRCWGSSEGWGGCCHCDDGNYRCYSHYFH